ncbi:hypothetical protein ACNKHX_06095 [Shigella flexneri]
MGFSLTSLWAGKYSDSYHWLWRELYQRHGLRRVWHLRCTDTLKGRLLESYEICQYRKWCWQRQKIWSNSAQRLSEVCRVAGGSCTDVKRR